jgi:hypothetical protein
MERHRVNAPPATPAAPKRIPEPASKAVALTQAILPKEPKEDDESSWTFVHAHEVPAMVQCR